MTASTAALQEEEIRVTLPGRPISRLLRSGALEFLVLIAFLGLIVYPTVLLYLPLVRNGFFVSDDHILLREATMTIGWQAWPNDPWIFSGVRHLAMWRPAGTLKWFWNAAATTSNPAWYYAVNLGLHLVNALLVLTLTRLLGLGIVGGLVGAAIFALHPIATETVGWLAARFDLVATAFALAALIIQLASNRLANPRLWQVGRAIAPLLLLLSLLAKESAVVIPAIAVLCLLTIGGSGTVERSGGTGAPTSLVGRFVQALRSTWMLWIVVLAYVALRFALLGTLGGYGDYLSTTPYWCIRQVGSLFPLRLGRNRERS